MDKEYSSKNRLYRIWLNMKQRCNNPNNKDYIHYGSRGIKVCKEWENSFVSFRDWALNNGYTEELTLDRKNNERGYSPDNCRWITVKEQNSNKRNNRFLTYKGQTLTFTQWEEKLGLYKGALRDRIDRYGWSVIKALETPVHHKIH